MVCAGGHVEQERPDAGLSGQSLSNGQLHGQCFLSGQTHSPAATTENERRSLGPPEPTEACARGEDLLVGGHDFGSPFS